MVVNQYLEVKRLILFLTFWFAYFQPGFLFSSDAIKPNVILITVDTLRADHLGCYGYKQNTSPNIDKFSSRHIQFNRCYSQASETAASLSSLLTGCYPHETKIRRNEIPLPLNLKMLAEILKENGYITKAIVGNFVLRKKMQFNQGFDDYDDNFTDPVLTRKTGEKRADSVTNAAIPWLETNKQKTFFLWLHYMDPHGPYTPPAPYDRMFKVSKTNDILNFNNIDRGENGIPAYQRLGDHRERGFYVSQYEGEIRFLDENLGHLFNAIKKLGLENNSLIILTADHGEELGEHGNYFCHGEWLYNELIHVPLILSWQGKQIKSDSVVQLIDIFRTVLETAGIPFPSLNRGQNILAEKIQNETVFSEIRNWESVTAENLTLICDAIKDQCSLFNVLEDPLQSHDLASDSAYQEQVSSLKDQLERIAEEDSLNMKEKETLPPPDEETIESLKSLGYTQ